jgi:Na+/H+ antiporter NhaD/arsenite permease-like protein
MRTVTWRRAGLAKVAWEMSAAAAALYAAVIAGVFTLIGAVVGLVVADRLRRRGDKGATISG